MPARLDLLESGTGLLLALFMVMHSLSAAAILLGPEASSTMARAFKGEFLFGRPYPGIVVVVTVTIIALFVVHAVLAMRKVPAGYAQYARFRDHQARLSHADTTLWWWQVVTGVVVMGTTMPHLYDVLMHPSEIGSVHSADEIWSGRMWPLYLVLLPAVQLHVGIGLYRLALKWGWFETDRSARVRRWLQRGMWTLIAGFICLGLFAIGAYAKLGYEQAKARSTSIATSPTVAPPTVALRAPGPAALPAPDR